MNQSITPTELLLIAHSFNQVTTERAALLLLPSLNTRQRSRMRILNSAMALFESYLEDLGEVPTGSWITRALKAA